MSQALFERAASGRHVGLSAGTRPAAAVHPAVVQAMLELGVDLSACRPALLTREMVERVDVVVTMGCGEDCPLVPGKRYIEWELDDPAERPLAEVRAIRDEILRRTATLVVQLDAEEREAARDADVDGEGGIRTRDGV